jgi:hypothetical protein
MGGVAWSGRGPNAGFSVPQGNVYGNNLPGFTGAVDQPTRPGPGPSAGGNAGGGTGDQFYGADPRADKVQPYPASPYAGAWTEDEVIGQTGPPLPYGGTGAAGGWAGRTGTYGDPQSPGPEGRQSFRRYGTLGFNDKLTVKDRHAYWDTGNQRSGTEFVASSSNPNAYNNPRIEPPRPDLRLVNRTVSYQLGTDATRNQDDRTRGYSWLGEQGSGWGPVYGGVPGLYQPYGSRGGIPYPIVAPVEQGAPGDGPHLVFSGPAHGLHSQTPWKGGAQIIARYTSTPQTRPVRQDRPSNSPQAGQSYSQTVLPQGATRVRPGGGRGGGRSASFLGGRGWAGQVKTGPGGVNWVTGRNL